MAASGLPSGPTSGPALARLTADEALALRLRSLWLLDSPAQSVADVVTWFGALQAQDYASGLYSLGVRVGGATRASVEEALERGEAIRTWPMRGTLHLVPPADAGWMVRLTGERVLAQAGRRRDHLGLDTATVARAVDVLGEALAGGGRLTRAQCIEVLQAAGIDTSSQRAYHLLWYAAQVGVTCVTPNLGGEQTFALLDDWAGDPNTPSREQALATLAVRYVRSHGPVPVSDFAGWTGLTMADARTAVAAAGKALVPVLVDGAPMLAAPDLLDAPLPVREPRRWHVLPGFDEYLLGYKDRSLMLGPDMLAAVVPGRNGVFQPTVVHGGRVVGVWKRKSGPSRTRVTVTPLVGAREWTPAAQAATRAAFAGYADYLGQPVEVLIEQASGADATA